MKTITLLSASLLLVVSVTQATESFSNSKKMITTNWIDNQEPIGFIERGITFYVFTDGQFDFNTDNNSQGSVFYKSGRRNTNDNFGANGQNHNEGTLIEHDSRGRIRRVGNVFINYDFNDRIKRIGSVYVSYNRFAVSQIGGLRLIYNRFGQITNMVGSVKNNFNSSFGTNNFAQNNYSYYGQSNGMNYNNNFNNGNNYNNNSSTDYYYRNNNSKMNLDDSKTKDSISVIINR